MNNYFYLQAIDNASVIKLNNNGRTPDIKYSKNGTNWTQWDYTELTINANTKMYFKGDNGFTFSWYLNGAVKYCSFYKVSGGKVLAGGNIMSLLDDGACTRTEVGNYCFYELFSGFKGLDIDDSFILPATTLGLSCYEYMFLGCSNLTKAPELPATTLSGSCYSNMFRNCTSLTTAPELPATSLKGKCYNGMFSLCTSLTKAPELTATTLEPNCYNKMFDQCTSLTKAPELPATILANQCYYEMFYGCTSLNSITCLAEDISATDCTYRWLNGVSETGTFVKSENMSGWTRSTSGIPVGWNVENYIKPGYFYIKSLSESTIKFNNSLTNYPSLYYKLNNNDWVEWNRADISLASNDIVYFKGNNDQLYTDTNNSLFVLTNGSVKLGGHLTSLTDGDKYETSTTERRFQGLFKNCTAIVDASELILPKENLGGYNFQRLFYGCNSLLNAPNILGESIGVYACQSMFEGCSSLTTAPAISATSVDIESCSNMFKGCTSLTTAPSILPATTLGQNCYKSMFQNCSSLTTAPELPATTLANRCYFSMFYGCKSLVKAPEIKATTLSNECCYMMFYNCTSLTTAPELPSTTLAPSCYANMFSRCSSLTTAPELPATTLANNCYQNMFNGCSKLNYIKALFTTTPSNSYTGNWVGGVASTGTFVKNKDATWNVTGDDGIPTGWNVETYPQTPTTYTLTVRGNNSRLTNGSSTNIGDATFDVSAVYEAGTSVTIGCKPKSGYRFVQWNDGNTNSERTVVVNSDITYTATVVKTYTIMAQDESVHHCYVRGTGVYDENSVAELTVEPFEGYMFSHWEDNSTDLPRYITVTEDKTVWAEAVVEPTKYTVTLQGDNCTLNGGGTYYEGTNVEISCIPNTGYYFVRWSDGNTNATRTITVTEDITLTAITAQGSSEYLEIKARKGSGEYERTNIIWNLDYKVNSFIWDARVYTDFDNLTTNFEISDNRVTNISKGSSWIGDSRIYSFEMTVPRNDSDTNKEFTINITSNNGILSDTITIRVIQKPKLPVLIKDIFVSSGDVENALVTIPDTMGEVLVVYEDETLARYTIDDCVSNYVLYYRNALGGIDLFPVTGKVIKSNDIEHLTINKKYDNRTPNFGKTNYENVLTEKWQLYSGRLTDQQSKLMHHLINSTYVYLYDIQADKFTPVVITDTEMEYKTYKNNNNKMVYYTINVEASQTKYRR